MCASRRAVEEPAAVDVSIPAQIADIERTFKYAGDDFDLTKLRHPSKPGLTAVDSYEILPDAETWANAYDLFRFSERPGERPMDVSRLFLDAALTIMMFNVPFRLTIHVWNVLFCDPWNPTATTSWRFTW